MHTTLQEWKCKCGHYYSIRESVIHLLIIIDNHPLYPVKVKTKIATYADGSV